jgi:hypothetical protein
MLAAPRRGGILQRRTPFAVFRDIQFYLQGGARPNSMFSNQYNKGGHHMKKLITAAFAANGEYGSN